MKKGISMWAFHGEMSVREIFQQAKKCGFDGVEVAMDPVGAITPQSTDEEILEIKKYAEETGIELYSVAAGVYWAASLTSDDEVQRETAKKNAKRQLEIAKLLGCETILVVPGHVGVEFAPELGVVDYETAYNRALSAARELASYAEELGVVIGMENVWNKFLQSPLEMRSFLEAVGSDYVKSYFDVGNVLANGYPEQWIRILKKRIAKVHFKDFKNSVRTLEGFCDLLEGDVDYKAVMEAFREIGYDGWVTAEVFPYASNNEVKLMQTSLAMDAIIN